MIIWGEWSPRKRRRVFHVILNRVQSVEIVGLLQILVSRHFHKAIFSVCYRHLSDNPSGILYSGAYVAFSGQGELKRNRKSLPGVSGARAEPEEPLAQPYDT